MPCLEDDKVKKEIKEKCKIVQYCFSTRDFKSTVALPAAVLLMNCADPVPVFDKVCTVDSLY